MIQVIKKGNAFALFQNKSNARLTTEKFKELIKFLKTLFTFEFDPVLFGTNQGGYLYFCNEEILKNAINLFLNRSLYDVSTIQL